MGKYSNAKYQEATVNVFIILYRMNRFFDPCLKMFVKLKKNLTSIYQKLFMWSLAIIIKMYRIKVLSKVVASEIRQNREIMCFVY